MGTLKQKFKKVYQYIKGQKRVKIAFILQHLTEQKGNTAFIKIYESLEGTCKWMKWWNTQKKHSMNYLFRLPENKEISIYPAGNQLKVVWKGKYSL